MINNKIIKWSRAESSYPNKTISDLFGDIVKKYSEKIAVRHNDKVISYNELNKLSSQIATQLKKINVDKNKTIGLHFQRSIEYLITVLGIIKFGAVYLPLNVQSPAKKNDVLIDKTELALIITDGKQATNYTRDIKTSLYSEMLDGEYNNDIEVSEHKNCDNTFCLLYTSGTTGEPKGVEITHRGIIRLVINTNYIKINSHDRIAHLSNLAFDASNFEIWGALLNGAELVIIDNEILFSVYDLADCFLQNNITILFLTTTLFNLMAREAPYGFTKLKYLLFGGEQANATIVYELQRKLECTLINGYGPTECTTFSSAYVIEKHSDQITPLPIGKPISNTEIYILNEKMQLVDIGEVGEIYIGGDGVANGYYKDIELSKQKFLDNCINPSSNKKLYKTGDMGKCLNNGLIEYVGRIDKQVKIRGFRVEIGEIENCLYAHPLIKQVAIITQKNVNDSYDLIAFIKSDIQVSYESIIELLTNNLPSYMIPYKFYLVKKIPMTENGKLDITGLLNIEKELITEHVIEKHSDKPIEIFLINLCALVLNINTISSTETISSLGIDSIKVMQILSRIYSVYKIKITFSEFYSIKNLNELAVIISRRNREDSYPPLTFCQVVDKISISFPQRRLWFLSQNDLYNKAYNVPVIFRLKGSLNINRLESAINDLVKKHQSLRTSFSFDGQQIYQVINTNSKIKVIYKNLTTVYETERENFWIKLTKDIISTSFDLNVFPLFSVNLLHLSHEEYILVFNFHHIIVDAWSLKNIIEDFNQLYNSEHCDISAENLYQYSDYTNWYYRLSKTDIFSKQLIFWQNKLEGLKPLVFSKHTNLDAMNKDGVLRFILEEALTKKLISSAKKENVTLFSYLLTAFFITLYSYTSQEDLALGVPVANRKLRELEKIVGFMVNTIIIRAQLQKDKTLKDFLKFIHQEMINAQENSDVPYDILVSKLNPLRDSLDSSLFNCLFIMENTPQYVLNLESLDVKEKYFDQIVAKYDLTLSFTHKDNKLLGFFEYKGEYFTNKLIRRIVGNYKFILNSLLNFSENRILDIVQKNHDHSFSYSQSSGPLDFYVENSLKEVFEKQVQLTPNSMAIIYKDVQLNYLELNHKSNQLAHYLLSEGIYFGKIIALFMDRSIDLIISIIALCKIGAICLPLDSSYPIEQLNNILKNCAVDKLLFGMIKEDNPFKDFISKTINYTENKYINYSTLNPIVEIKQDATLYIIFTSGSTGIQKGIKISHSILLNLIKWQVKHAELNVPRNVLQFSAISFDVSHQEIWSTLCFGSKLILIDEITRKDDIKLIKYMNDYKVERAYLPFVKLQALSEAATTLDIYPKYIKEIISTGEQLYCSAYIKKFFSKIHPATLYNMYGPSETHVVSYYKLQGEPSKWEEVVPIGKPISNTSIKLLDDKNRLVVLGSIGEIAIVGYRMRPCYNSKEENGLRFIFDKENNQYIYKTGDLGQYDDDGNLLFLGRKDGQIKLNGYRVEIGHLESCLLMHPSVLNAAVLQHKENNLKNYLIAYIIPKDRSISSEELKSYLKKNLPSYITIYNIVFLDRFPLTSSGKLDRKKLARTETIQIYPDFNNKFVNNNEKIIIEVISDILNLHDLNVEQKFFDMGADSLSLAKIYLRLYQILSTKLTLVDLFKYPTVSLLSEYIQNLEIESLNNLTLAHKEVKSNITDQDIAIIGMAGKFPGANNIEEFWENICHGRESVVFLDASSSSSFDEKNHFVAAKSSLENIYGFDAAYFGISEQEAKLMDPQQRHFLMGAVHVLEAAGYDSNRYNGKIGVVATLGENTYYSKFLLNKNPSFDSFNSSQISIANEKDYLATKCSYYLNLTGPSYTIQSACSSSLVAVHLAINHLLNDECDMVIAGGILIDPTNQEGYLYKEGFIFSPDGHCRPFDADAKGTYGSSGYGLVLMKKLKKAQCDKDTIYAVIKGSAINNDGNLKVGYTAPSVKGQAEVINLAQKKADVLAEQISYIETHGTGTSIGDPIEIEALHQVFKAQTKKLSFCAISSLKSQIGHMGAAAGIAGLIRVTLALHHKKLPPSINFKSANPYIDFSNSPFFVNTECKNWNVKESSRYAAVSSFGIGGTNAHIVLSEYISTEIKHECEKEEVTIVLSAKTKTSLHNQCIQLATYLEKNKELNLMDVAYTLNVGRSLHKHQILLKSDDMSDLIINLKKCASNLDNDKLLLSGESSTVPRSENGKCIYLPGYVFDLENYDILGEIITKDKDIKRNTFSDWFYGLSWIKHNYCDDNALNLKDTVYIIFLDRLQIGEKFNKMLLELGANVIRVHQSEDYFCQDQNTYFINIERKEHYERFVHEISKFEEKIAFIHLLSIGKPAEEITSSLLSSSEQYSFFSFINLIQAANKILNQRDLKILVISNNIFDVLGNEELRAEASLILGPCKVIPQEYQNVTINLFDFLFDELIFLNENTVKKILSNLENISTFFAYRNDHFWKQHYVSVLNSKKNLTPKIREQGVYLITGGLGGIGLTLATYISRFKNVKIILLSRSNFPDASTWHTMEFERLYDAKTKLKVKQIQECIKIGAQIEIAQADIANQTEMKIIFEKIFKKYKKLNGVINCAGLPAGGIIALKSMGEARKIFHAKVYGTLCLNYFVKGYNLDFFINCSSLASILGGAGQVDYCAANNFLDSFTKWCSSKNKKTLWKTINWDTWNTVGMAIEERLLPNNLKTVQQQELTLGLTPNEGIDCFAHALNSSLNQIIISTTSLDIRRPITLNSSQPSIVKIIKNNVNTLHFTEIESMITAIFSKYLGIKITPHDNFYDFGGHSLMALEVIAEINKVLSDNVSISDIIKHDTPHKLALLLDKSLTTKNPVKLSEKKCTKVLFLFHPIGGDIIAYKEIAKNMEGHFEIYAIQDPILLNEGQIYSSIEEKAKIYCNLIKDIQPNDEYYLAGWSFGALIAAEVARIFELQNYKVIMLALIDPPLPANQNLEVLKKEDLNLSFIKEIIQRFSNHNLSILPDFTEMTEENLFPTVTTFLNISQHEAVKEYFQRLLTAFRINITAMYKYEPSNKIKGRVLVFQASKSQYFNLKNEWQNYSERDLEYYLIDGDHYSILKSPSVVQLANIISDYTAEKYESPITS